jgi:hypothetical protein
MHPDDYELHSWIDGELEANAKAIVDVHVATCESCRTRTAEMHTAERRLYASLAVLDVPAPTVSFASVAARASQTRVPWRRIAAAVIVTLSLSGVAIASVRGPLALWVAAAARLFSTERAPARRSPPTPSAPVSPAGIAGVAMRPGRSISVSFAHNQAGGDLRIVLVDDSVLQLTAPTGAATFTSSSGALLVNNAGSSASFDVRIPRGAARVEIRIADRVVYLKVGSHVSPGASTDGAGVTILPLVAGEPVSRSAP